MSLIAPESGKTFEKPVDGRHLGTIIDIVDLGLVQSKDPNNPAPVHRIQIIWVLNTNDKEGKPLLYSEAPPFKVGEGGGKYQPTRLYKVAKGVLGTEPPRPLDVEILLGRSNELFIVTNNNRQEIVGFVPVPPGATAPQAPSGFVRKVNRPAKQNQQPVSPATQQAVQQAQNGATEVAF